MKYLTKHVSELLLGRIITYRGMVYWADPDTMTVHGQSVEAQMLGSIMGYKVADITPDLQVVKVK